MGKQEVLISRYKARGLSLEELLESLTDLGNCPALIFDDNGHWAVSESGLQTVPTGETPEDMTSTFIVEAMDWKKNIRKAVIHYYEQT